MNKQQVLLIHGGTTYATNDAYLADLKTKTPKLEWILSCRDWKFAVPFSHLSKYQQALPVAHFRAFTDRNHFLQASVPELVADIKS